jgi:antitoxin (DNA-binding transcriptional repressor) of toxin-antitoxin stability system
MVQVNMSEAEIARDFAAVLAKVRAGTEVIVEDGYRRIASITPIGEPGREIDECIAILKGRASNAALDDEYAGDLKSIIADRKPLDTSAWE